MPFHHVLITFSNSPKKPRCVFSDLSEKQLNELFLSPYRKGKDILCGNEVVRSSNILNVQIIRTDKPCAEELSIIQDRSLKEIDDFNRHPDGLVLISIGRGHDLEDIVEAGTDVTAKHVVGPPGYAASNMFAGLLHNPWVVGIGLVLISLILGALL